MAGIRDIQIERDDNGKPKKVEVLFGEHHRVTIEENEGKTSFSLVYTHHGFKADASDVPSELEQFIGEIAENHPENATDL